MAKKTKQLTAQIRARIEAKVDKILHIKGKKPRLMATLELAASYETDELNEYLERILKAEQERKGFARHDALIDILHKKVNFRNRKTETKRKKRLKIKRKRMKDFETPGDYYQHQVKTWQAKLDSWNRGKQARRAKKMTKAERVRAELIQLKNDPDVRDIFEDINIKTAKAVADGEE